MPTRQTALSAFACELAADSVPNEVHMLPPGPFRALDGRPAECAAWQLDAAIAARVVDLATRRKNDIGLFFEHQDFYARFNGQRAEACGWCPRTLDWREGSGLWATGITWVGDTAELIRQKKYRYISALFTYDIATGEIVEILSIALTNTPALDGLDALADLARQFTDHEEDGMPAPDQQTAALTAERDTLKTQVASLTAERDGLNTKLAALTAERDGLQTKVTALEQEKATAALAAETAKRDELLAAALKDGRLTPAQKDWAGKQNLAALTEYLEATPPLSIAGGRQSARQEDGNHGLTAEELAMCSRMNVRPEDYKKAKA